MQSNDQQTGTEGALNHPGEAEWMALLYEEVPSARKTELLQHLRECPECAQRIAEWRISMRALDHYRVPHAPRTASRKAWSWQPVVRWASAAALILAVGFILGRTTGSAQRQISELQSSVARLAQAQQTASTEKELAVLAATEAATAQTLRLLNAYAQTADNQRLIDQRNTATALGKLDNRINGLRTELETVAVNTQDGLQETHAGLAQLALLTRSSSVPVQRVKN